MINKSIIIIVAAAMLSLFASSSAMAAFQDLELIRVIYERTTGTVELVTDLGAVTTVSSSSATFPGSFGSFVTPGNLYAVYWALDRTTNKLWVSGSTDTTKAPIAVGTLGFNTTKSASTSVYSYYNSALVSPDANGVFTGSQSYPNSYRLKLSASPGSLANGINFATRVYTEANLGPLVDGSGTPMVSQNLYYFANANAGGSQGVAIATITTNADGSTTIAPIAAKTDQTIGAITFTPATLAVYGTTTAGATATSGLPVSFSSTTPTVCTVSGSTVTGVASGTCGITASQAGNGTYNAAPPVSQNITVLALQAIGSITFTPPNLTAGSSSTASAVSNSNLPVSFGSATPTTCTVSGSTVTGVSIGPCTITANQAGDATFAPASQVTQNITVVAPIIKINAAMVPLNTLGAALAAPVTNASILLQAAPVFAENVVMDNPVSIQLNGGYTDAGFTNQTSFTNINGSLTIKRGTLKVRNIIVM